MKKLSLFVLTAFFAATVAVSAQDVKPEQKGEKAKTEQTGKKDCHKGDKKECSKGDKNCCKSGEKKDCPQAKGQKTAKTHKANKGQTKKQLSNKMLTFRTQNNII